MKEKLEVLFSEEKIKERLDQLAEEIKKDYKDKNLTLICILKGGVFFFVDLAKRLNDYNIEIDFMDISSYGYSSTSDDVVKINKDIENSIEGKDVLLIEDIIDTGKTLNYLQSYLKSKKAESVNICTFLDKPERRIVKNISPKYIGFEVPNKFIVGYGLDYRQKYRTLPYVGIINI